MDERRRTELEPQEATGRWLVRFPGRDSVAHRLALLRELGVEQVATSSDGGAGGSDGGAGGPDGGTGVPDGAAGLLLERLGIAVLTEAPVPSAARAPTGPGAPTLERERWMRMPQPRAVAAPAQELPTWGLRALGLQEGPSRRRDGAGIGLAVLDTGLDLTHPDLADRLVASTSLVPGQPVQDVQGHGTHCAGTACGPPAYGVAPAAGLHAVKVLGDDGRGREADVLAGVEWAVERGCRVVSMSLSSPGGGPVSRVFEEVAADLLQDGVVLVAAAGNDSARPGRVAPLGHPASCPSVIAVGAVDRRLEVAAFSNGGAELDVVGPGVDVLSAWPGGGTRALSGTSMATPHVAGLLAVLLQRHPGLTLLEVLGRLRASAQPLTAPADDVGAGLVRLL